MKAIKYAQVCTLYILGCNLINVQFLFSINSILHAYDKIICPLFHVDVKLGLSHSGINMGWGC